MVVSSSVLEHVEQVLVLLDDGDELLLRDGAIRVLVQLLEQLLSLGHVCRSAHHLVHSEDSPGMQ